MSLVASKTTTVNSVVERGSAKVDQSEVLLVSVVIPVFRNQQSLQLTTQRIISELSKPFEKPIDYELVFIDDGSDDGSLDTLLEIRKQNQKIKVLELTRNFGQVAAIQAGFNESKGRAVINLTADLQDPAELISEMVESWLKGSEVVICTRADRKDGFATKIFSNTAWRIIRNMIPMMPIGGFDIFLLDRNALDTFLSIKSRNRFLQGDILSLGYRTQLIPYTRNRREFGKSQFTFGKKLKYLIDAIIDSSYLPIRFMSAAGILTSLSGFAYALVIVLVWFQKSTPAPGWAPIMILILILGGSTMFMLGIIGEYIWRILDEVKQRPLFIVRKKHTD